MELFPPILICMLGFKTRASKTILKFSLAFGIGLKFGLATRFASGQVREKRYLPSREIHLPQTTTEMSLFLTLKTINVKGMGEH